MLPQEDPQPRSPTTLCLSASFSGRPETVTSLSDPSPIRFKNLHRNSSISRTCPERITLRYWLSDVTAFDSTFSHPCSVARMAHASAHRLTELLRDTNADNNNKNRLTVVRGSFRQDSHDVAHTATRKFFQRGAETNIEHARLLNPGRIHNSISLIPLPYIVYRS